MIWIGSPLPRKYLNNIRTYRRLGYPVKLWTKPPDNMVNKDIFDRMTTWAGKADVMRLEILYNEGGLYTDMDSAIKRHLPIKSDLVVMTSASGYIANETIYATKGHPALKEAIDGLKANVDLLSQRDSCNIWEICGATYITPIFQNYPHIKLPHSMIGKRRDKPMYITHSYDGSWSEGITKSQPKPLEYWLSKS